MAVPLYKKRKLAYPEPDARNGAFFRDRAHPKSSNNTSLRSGIKSLAPLSDHKQARGNSAPAVYHHNAHHNGLTELKIEELLSQVRPHYDRMAKVDSMLRKLRQAIEAIPSREALPVSEAIDLQKSTHGIPIPFPEPRPNQDAKYKLAFSTASSITVVGSYARKTAIRVRNHSMVDLAVEMPSTLFQDKDYLDYRYFHKRAYYLACIATGLQCDPSCRFKLEFAYQNGNPLQPSIIVNSSTAGGEDDFSKVKYQIQIILVTDARVFPCAKTLPNRNCIRLRDSSAERDPDNRPTPFYNATLRSECLSLVYMDHLQTASANSSAFNDACILGNVWLEQRGFNSYLAGGGFGPFEWACITALLMHGGSKTGQPVLYKEYNSYQMFKATLQYLAGTDLVHTPAFIYSDPFQIDNLENPVLYDGVRGLNVLFKMSSWSYNSLRRAATVTMKLLADCLEDHFESCFIMRLDTQLLKYDYIVRLSIEKMRSQDSSRPDSLDHCSNLCYQIQRILYKGLGDRVNLIDLKFGREWPCTIDESKPQQSHIDEIVIGMLVNADKVDRAIDKGPSAEETEKAANFRKFWGEKAELRRFKDGSILESLIWSSSHEGQSILHQIVSFLFQRHLKNFVHSIDIVGGDQAERNVTPTTSQDSFTAFESLEKQIGSLEGLPLQVRQVSLTDSQLHCSVPRASDDSTVGNQLYLAKVCLQFEGSNRWPDDYAAVQRTKIALLLKIGDILEASTSDLVTRVGLENTSSALANFAFLDIVSTGGAAFRIRIHHEREHLLIERELKYTSKSAKDREATASALHSFQRHFCQAPLHTQNVRMVGTRFPFLFASIRLLKRWRDRHLLSDHISDELIELLTIRTFVHPGPYSVPGNSMVGFLRTLLFISRWDWRTEPVIVDPKSDMKTEDIDAINLRFQAWRKVDPAMNKIVLFAASNVDHDGIAWTEQGPSKVAAARFTDLARAAVGLVETQDLNLEAEALFIPNFAEYDFIINLDTELAHGKRGRAAGTRFKNLHFEAKYTSELTGFDPVRSLLKELRSLYGSSVVLFYDATGRDKVGGLWNPITGPRPWKVNLDFSTTPINAGGGETEMVAINKMGTLNDIARLGAKMISSIEMRR